MTPRWQEIETAQSKWSPESFYNERDRKGGIRCSHEQLRIRMLPPAPRGKHLGPLFFSRVSSQRSLKDREGRVRARFCCTCIHAGVSGGGYLLGEAKIMKKYSDLVLLFYL